MINYFQVKICRFPFDLRSIFASPDNTKRYLLILTPIKIFLSRFAYIFQYSRAAREKLTKLPHVEMVTMFSEDCNRSCVIKYWGVQMLKFTHFRPCLRHSTTLQHFGFICLFLYMIFFCDLCICMPYLFSGNFFYHRSSKARQRWAYRNKYINDHIIFSRRFRLDEEIDADK